MEENKNNNRILCEGMHKQDNKVDIFKTYEDTGRTVNIAYGYLYDRITIILSTGTWKLVKFWVIKWKSTGAWELVPAAYIRNKMIALATTGITYQISTYDVTIRRRRRGKKNAQKSKTKRN